VHDRPADRFDWAPVVRYGVAFGGLAVLGYFAFQIFHAPHLERTFKYVAIGVIAAIGIAGASAILQRDPAGDDTGERLYTAAEVADLLNAVRAAGGVHIEAAAAQPASCAFCGKPGAEVRGLDGTRYHRACFQTAYRERERERDAVARRR
jgi:hypothetical protein